MSEKQPKLRLVIKSDGAASPERNLPASDRRLVEIDWSIMMARAQDGDAIAYRKLLSAMTPYVRSLARRYLQHPSDAEDALQDVLIAIHMLRATYDPRRPFGPWLKAIANRKIIDRLRQVSKHRSREDVFTDDLLNLAQPERQEDLSPAGLDQDQILKHLPASEAQALRLTKLEGLTLEEASAASGQSISAIKVATHRAMKRLRTILSKDRQYD
jgi:RNA polymerase sigma-70 factor (ECF subfamily)